VKPVRFEPEAQEEFLAAIDWYEEREPGLGGRFLTAVEGALQKIQQAPETYPVVPGTSRASSTARRRRLEDFPYAIVYLVRPDEVRVLAIAHGRRRPGYWKKRGL